ncbi:cupredoxin family copper-binding protein [Terrarubrum flagellatum]|uniref:cupredoxin domain-containing protein n=1 Tax=Terrirubrum flagellatum TaxID=2895980 RepID=UPI003144E389
MSNLNSTRRGALAFVVAALSPEILRAAQASEEIKVDIDNFSFSPEKLEVKVGSTVIWENRDDIPHNIVATGKQFKSPVLDTGEVFRFTFTAPGTYDYFCGLHPHMTGSVIVSA